MICLQRRGFVALLVVGVGLLALGLGARAADEVIPHAQDKPPGPPLSPAEAIAKMTVPAGFQVELVASEPDIVNPVAMTFDERGRIWITESLEYPRQSAGPGQDRIKVLEDTDGDGRADRFTVFAEGLNIPSGIAVGHGGVWVANAPDILFLQDTDGDGKADRREVVVTGFGRDDTHELPNSLTWGPDGWLYGLNGVFNQSHVTQGDRTFDFTCALFRIHPRTREFQLFCQGTSNPWGVAWDGEGSAFVSACVIDHLWHLAESAYYIRQGGPYPPHTTPMGSIVKHKHQKAAYCGIHYFDSDAYPAEFRDRLYMGNIHGNGINVDRLERDGSTYSGLDDQDFLRANDAWFMPVVQKTGPDGCLYVLDWYDRYHCYQDARRDPAGIDRLKGRLYRIRYRDAPRAAGFNLATESDARLIERLQSPNNFYRDLAQRILCERRDAASAGPLEKLATDDRAPRKARLHAIWTLVGSGLLTPEFHRVLLTHNDPGFRAWGVRAAGNLGQVDEAVSKQVVALASDPSPDVRLQVVIAARKIAGVDPVPLWLIVLASSGDDKLIPHVVWQNLHPLLEEQGERYLQLADSDSLRNSPAVVAMMPRVIDRLLSARKPELIELLVKRLSGEAESSPAALQKCLAALTRKRERREISEARLAALRPTLTPLVDRVLSGSPADPLYVDVTLLATIWKDPRAVAVSRATLAAPDRAAAQRAQALDALVATRDETLEASIERLFSEHSPAELRSAAIASLAHLEDAWVARVLLAHYAHLEPELRPKVIEILTERRAWAEQLLEAIGREQIPTAAINVNQVRQLLLTGDASLVEKVKARWGTLRSDRDPQREQVIGQMRTFLRHTPGDPQAGQQVFARVCGQCHKLHGTGQDVGPDITANGRSSFEQLLSNVFDPSLVIGAAYQARTVVTEDGRVVTGLVAEESDERIVLKAQGGKLETIARADIAHMKTSPLSLMPEDLEKQLKPQELADLFALLTLDKPPQDATARKLPGSQPIVARETTDPAQYSDLVSDVAPGFKAGKLGRAGVAIVAEHLGRDGVLRTWPSSAQEAGQLRAKIDVPAGKRTRLVISVASDHEKPWNLVVSAGGKRLHQAQIGHAAGSAAWQTLSLDLSSFAGNKINLELANTPVGDKPVPAYWGQIEVISE